MIHQMMDAIATSPKKNGTNSKMNGAVKSRVQNMAIALNVHIRRKGGMKNELFKMVI